MNVSANLFKHAFNVLLGALLLLVTASSNARAEGTDLGLELVPYSKKVGEHRYESPRDFDGTVKFFHDKFKGSKVVLLARTVSLASVKYVHITNANTTSKWEGANIYLMADGHVRYFILQREAAPTTPVAPSKSVVPANKAP